jgi:hypothetical protein
VEAGSNASTVTLRVVEDDDEKGSLKSETVNYRHESKGLGLEKDYAGEGQQHIRIKDRPVLSSERAPHKNKTVIVKQ